MAMYLADLCTIPSDLAGNAAISVPCGLAPEDGLPVGLQVMAPALADDRLYRVAAAAEAALTAAGASRCSPRRRDSPDDQAKGRGAAWTEERGTSDEGRRCLKAPRRRNS